MGALEAALRSRRDGGGRAFVPYVTGARDGVKKDAAELMGISQRALSYYLAEYRID